MSEATGWGLLSDEVGAGNLRLDPGVARRCAQHCSDFIEQLKVLRVQAGGLGRLDGLGTFPSGVALARKFGEKATGGAYSMVSEAGEGVR